MEYTINSEPSKWPFSTNENKIGEKSYILLDEKIENEFHFTPNKKLLFY